MRNAAAAAGSVLEIITKRLGRKWLKLPLGRKVFEFNSIQEALIVRSYLLR
jgi:hypothetical protein